MNQLFFVITNGILYMIKNSPLLYYFNWEFKSFKYNFRFKLVNRKNM